MKERIIKFILDEYGVNAEYLFKDDTAIFRNPKNKKWFGAFMRIPASKLGLKSDRLVEIINLKNHPADVSMLRSIDGIYTAYHMNKENWITILLDGKLQLDMIFDLIDQSYQIIDLKK